jgi:predicted metal-binding protein
MQIFRVKTKNNEFDVECYSNFIRKKDIAVREDFFNEMCKNGCVNYGKKYSCPPFAPDFDSVIKENQGLYTILFKLNLNQIKSTEYNKIRIANSVLKSKIISLMRYLEDKFNTAFLGTGSCNLCKPCKLELNLPCKYPDKKRYSLEAVGIDCNKLSEKLFNFPLVWYNNKKAPEYSCVICGLICNEEETCSIEKELNKKVLTFIKDDNPC